MGKYPMYHAESRKLQDQFDTRRLAGRLESRLLRTSFTDAEGFPDRSHEGGVPLMKEVPGAQLLVRVTARHTAPNSPRYTHRMQLVERSEYVPAGNSARS